MKTWNFQLNGENIHLLLYSIIVVMSMIGPGMTIGYSAVALPILTQNSTCITLTLSEQSWFASLPTILQIFGSFFSLFTMKRGRRLAIASGSLVGSLGWILLATSCNVPQLLIARAVTGFSAGLCAAPSNIYLAEVSPLRRITLSSWCSVFISIGVLLVFFVGFLLPNDWSAVASISIIPPALSIVSTVLLLPESPRWLLTQSRKNDARNALLQIRGLEKETEKFQKEFDDMVRYNESRNDLELSLSQDTSARLNEVGEDILSIMRRKIRFAMNVLKLPEVWKPLMILNFFFFCQQFTGLYVVSTYTVDIVGKMNINADPFLVAVLLGCTQVICGISHICLLIKVGRRLFSIISIVGAFASLSIMVIHQQFFDKSFAPNIQLVCIFVFMAACSFGLLIAPWAMIGELYPTKYANALGALTTGLASFYNFIAVYSYPVITKHDMLDALYLYTIVALFGIPFIVCLLPETLGKTKLEIEANFRKGIMVLNK